ncbi:MAG: polysaccharide pyruvyl transferase family protein [Thermotogota bacterium]
MNIEIRKVQFVNKGAELMLYAILNKLKAAYPGAKFVMAPNKNSPFEKRADLGLWQKSWYWKYRVQWGDLANLLPKQIRLMYGIILDKEIDVVIDAAGFAYSDQLSPKSCSELTNSCKRWKKNGTKIILLPQAFGPFNLYSNKNNIRTIAKNVDLIFARENISYQNLVGIVGERPNIRVAPDFTNLIKGEVPDYFSEQINSFCIIPNYRMIDKTSDNNSKLYLPFLIRITKQLIHKKQNPFILVHEGDKDYWLAKEISKALDYQVPIYQENNPVKVKGIIGTCKGTIGSRFHGLVSSLSQNVPAIGTGWSHKYQMLFEDYNFSEGLINVNANENEIVRKLELIINSNSNQKIRNTIGLKSKELKNLSEKMWQDVFKVIEN